LVNPQSGGDLARVYVIREGPAKYFMHRIDGFIEPAREPDKFLVVSVVVIEIVHNVFLPCGCAASI
jgi:hypothetical protein